MVLVHQVKVTHDTEQAILTHAHADKKALVHELRKSNTLLRVLPALRQTVYSSSSASSSKADEGEEDAPSMLAGPTLVQKIERLILEQINQRDVVEDICKKKPKGVSDFEWQRRMRFYVDPSTELVGLRSGGSGNGDFHAYGYEFIGNNERVAYTPQVESTRNTILNAFIQCKVAALQGDVSTGKTATYMTLARTLGRFFLKFE